MSCRLLIAFVAFAVLAPACERSLPVPDILHVSPDMAIPQPGPDLLEEPGPDLAPSMPMEDAALPCAAESMARGRPAAIHRPVDIIVVIDNGPAMTEVTHTVTVRLNSFADVLKKAGADYRIIL